MSSVSSTQRGPAKPKSGLRDLGGMATTMPWWLFLVTGTLWILIAWIVLRFNTRSIVTIAVLAGTVILLAAVAEFFMAFTAPGWKWLHALLGVLFLITGVVTLAHPGNTFFWLSAFIGWYLLFKGVSDIILAFMTKATNEAWWLGLIVGIIQVMIGFWAAGRWTRSAYLLVVLVGVIALAHGITDIVAAFRFRKTTSSIDEIP